MLSIFLLPYTVLSASHSRPPPPKDRPPKVPPPSELPPQVALAQKGDRKAKEALLSSLLPRIRNLSRYLLRGDGDVDDVAQEAMIAVLRGLPGYRAEGSLHAWVDRIVARIAIDHSHKHKTERAQLGATIELSLVADGGEAPDEYTARRQAILLLDQVSNEQRHTLVLHHVVGMTVPEIAEAMQVPFETVRSRLRLGQAALRTLSERQRG